MQGMDADVQAFFNACIHCLISKGPDKIPRPFSNSIHASRPNKAVHSEYLALGESFDRPFYILLVKDYFSSYTWLELFADANAESPANSLSRWIRTLCSMGSWLSDQSSHFRNNLVETLAK